MPLEFVAAGSAEARRRFPTLDHADTLRRITVVADDGAVYREAKAWTMCLWALRDHRGMATFLATPAGRPVAAAMAAGGAAVRHALRRRG